MAAGGPGDHPVGDILDYGLSVYSPETDDLVRRIARLVPRERLWTMIDWFDAPPPPELHRMLADELAALEHRAREDGWELE